VTFFCFTKDFTDLLNNRTKPIDKSTRLIMTINIPAMQKYANKIIEPPYNPPKPLANNRIKRQILAQLWP